jgi:tetratricopeptide (TPR) repeat protein
MDYYEEALRRDPEDFRCNNAMGLLFLRKGQFLKAVDYFKKAIQTGTKRNPNPYDSEPYYNLGLALKYLGRVNESYDAFFKATWSSAWQDSGYFSVAQIDILRGDYQLALEHVDWSIDRNARNGKAYVIKVHALRKLGQIEKAIATAEHALERDGFNISVLFELHYCYKDLLDVAKIEEALAWIKTLSRGTAANLIEYGIEFGDLGLYQEAIALLDIVDPVHAVHPMVSYYRAYYSHLSGDIKASQNLLKLAAGADSAYCFPNRLEDILVLQFAEKQNPADAKAPYYLGNLWYDKRQYKEAMEVWKTAIEKDPQFATPFRNLAIAEYNKMGNHENALILFEQAFNLNTCDARVLMELDQLYKKLNYPAEVRIAFLKKHHHVASERDDLYLEMAALENFCGNYQTAYISIMARRFHPWEGGEGRVSGQYIYSLVEQAKLDIAAGNFQNAINKLDEAQVYPHSLGEGKLPGAQENDIFYWLACAYNGVGDKKAAEKYWQKATVGLSEPSAAMFYNDQQPDKIFYQGLAWERLGDHEQANQIFTNLVNYGTLHQHDEVRIDYFAVSLPDLLIFEDDLNARNFTHCQYIAGLGYLGLQNLKAAKKAFETVLQNDVMHFGARTHLNYLFGLI